ncbi:unnamed protein product [Tuber melanosporum]|uniref:(Perigord truffle) hypothetical protein n=1 Tax=Tuber melanosporum (strain Mel28) TaxID=656061 RepID=D5GD85_TUBMM|nr:uncharacterized protein GSTUM_00006090001 [Tuber melanosporum]CAZ82478.1 unnamed protein product [Tuber melanosporum]
MVRDHTERAKRRAGNKAIALTEHLLEPTNDAKDPSPKASMVRELIVHNDKPRSGQGIFTEQDYVNETRDVFSAIARLFEKTTSLWVLRWHSYDTPTRETIDTLAKKCPNLKETHISRPIKCFPWFQTVSVPSPPELFAPILHTLKSFRCSLPEGSIDILHHILENCKTLEALGIAFEPTDSLSIITPRGKPWNLRLKSLELVTVGFLTGSAGAATRFCSSFDLSGLERLRFDRCNDIPTLLEALSASAGIENLKHLSIWTLAGQTDMPQIMSFISQLGQSHPTGGLESLELADLGAKIDLKAIGKNKRLTVLRVAEWDAFIGPLTPSHIGGDQIVGPTRGRLLNAKDIENLGRNCKDISELWVDVARGAKLDELIISSFGSLPVLKKLGLCSQPPWKPLESLGIREQRPVGAEEEIMRLDQQAILGIAQLVHLHGATNLREIEVQYGCRSKPAEPQQRPCSTLDGGGRAVWRIRRGEDGLQVDLLRADRLVNRYGVPIAYIFEGWS